jgi:hypothetical protein
LIAAALAPFPLHAEELPGLPVSVVAASQSQSQVKVGVEPGVLNGMLQEPGSGDRLKVRSSAAISADDLAHGFDGAKLPGMAEAAAVETPVAAVSKIAARPKGRRQTLMKIRLR